MAGLDRGVAERLDDRIVLPETANCIQELIADLTQRPLSSGDRELSCQILLVREGGAANMKNFLTAGNLPPMFAPNVA